MNMVNVKLLLSAIIGGVVVTLLTGLIPNAMLLGATHYGYPFAWLFRLVLAPEYYPWRVDALFLIADLLVWIVVARIVLFALKRGKK